MWLESDMTTCRGRTPHRSGITVQTTGSIVQTPGPKIKGAAWLEPVLKTKTLEKFPKMFLGLP